MARNQKKAKGNKLYDCELCKKMKKDNVVACDECDKWFHFGCVNLVSIGKKDTWLCPTCKKDTSLEHSKADTQQDKNNKSAQSKETTVQQVVPPSSNPHEDINPKLSKQSDAHQRISTSAKSSQRISSAVRCQLELAKMKEEKELERKYLEKKYSILMANCEESIVASKSTSNAHFDRESYTRSWVESQRKQQASIWKNEAEKREFMKRLNELRFSTTSPVAPENDPSLLEVQNHRSNIGQFSNTKPLINQFDEYVDKSTNFKTQKKSHKFGNETHSDWNLSVPSCNEPVLNVGRSADMRDGGVYDLLATPVYSREPLSKYVDREPFVPRVSRNPIFSGDVGREPTIIQDSQKFPFNPVKSPEDASAKNEPNSEGEMENRYCGQAKSLKPEDGCLLTKQQIASRHVVTKDLPLFNGKPEDWPLFYSKFKNSTKLCGYSDGENLDRLQKALQGNAFAAVRSRLFSSEQVESIIATLKMLYGRPELIINSLLKNLRQLPPPKSDKLNTLVDFALAVKNVSATIEQAELSSHKGNPILIQELVDRLPTSIKIEWAKYKSNIRVVTISTLGDWLYQLAETISTITEPTVQPSSNFKRDQNDKKEYRVNVHQRSTSKQENQLVKQHSQNNFTNSNQCMVCEKKCEHVEFCPTFIAYNVDQRWAEIYKKGLCRKCLGRHGRFCASKNECGVNGCTFKHHRFLHDDKKHFKETPLSETSSKKNLSGPSNVQTVSKSVNAHKTLCKDVLLKIVPVVLHFKDKFLQTFAYLDDGSDATMMNRRVAKHFGIKGTPEPLCLLWTDDIHRNENNSERVFIHISATISSPKYRLNGVRTVEHLGLPSQTLVKSELVRTFPYLTDVPFDDYEDATAEILIGLDMASLLVPLESVEGFELNQPIASKTRLGWTIHGPISNEKSSSVSLNSHTVVCPYQNRKDEILHQLVKEYFKFENFGVQVKNQLNLRSKDDERASLILEKYTKLKKDRYETSLLWKYDKFELPPSYEMAKKRLKCLEKHKPAFISSINDIINDYVSKGYVRKLTAVESKIQNFKTWYLPLFVTFHPKKPERLRLVFDAAATVQGISLNSMLLTGPDELTSMVDILRRFREKLVAFCGDIKEMYHQIEVREEDKNSQRFLWRNGDETKEPDEYILDVLPFGLRCSPATAQFVKNRNADKFAAEYPAAVNSIKKNHYVDDLLECEHTNEAAVQLYNKISEIHRRGGFQICKFISNSVEAMDLVGDQNDCSEKSLNLDTLGTDRVLGMYWNRQKDVFTFSLKFTNIHEEIISGQRIPTKRELLRILMTIFDPLGLISHFLIHIRIILQDVWRAKLNWDEEITMTEIVDAWKSWLKILPKVEQIEIPRVYSLKMTPNPPKSIECHMFVDASDKAFSAVAFLRVEDESGVECALMGSKARVAPLKYLSTPRLELQAGILGSRLLTSITGSQTFKVNRRVIWSDSMTVLSWIRSDHRKFHQFVAHRIGEILDSTDVNEWRYVPSHLNVADDATKWSCAPSFESTNRWFASPDFLKLDEENWPQQPEKFTQTKEEMKVHCVHAKFRFLKLINPERFSNWNRMVRALAYVKRYVDILRCKVRNEKMDRGHISRNELIWSKHLLFKQAQFECYPDEMVILTRNKTLPESKQKEIRKSSPVYNLSPVLDENGLMRLRGRLDAANIPYDMKRPVILPRKCRITSLLVLNCHQTYHHRNMGTVVNELRQEVHIPSIRQVVKSVRKNECQRCKNRDSKPKPPEMGNLPFGRLAVGFRPFTYVGIDFFGPISVVVGRVLRKRWGVLFTCLTIRAVHIEIAHSISTDSCIMCIRNFIDLRGPAQEIFSDCGTNFTGMDNELQELVKNLDMDKIATHFTTFYTKWNFNPPESPHMGGSWERLVRSVKTSMYEMMTIRHPTDEMFRNMMMEAMNVVNSRPLTFIPIDNEEDEALTPNHFIHGNSNGIKSAVPYVMDGLELKHQWRECQRLADLFWARFVKEYMPTIVRRTKWFDKVPQLAVGDIVLIIDETNPRNVYPKARVLNIVVGSNGQVRRAQVQRADKYILWRSAAGLAKLDIQPIEIESSASITRNSNKVDAIPEKSDGASKVKLDVLSKISGGLADPTPDSKTRGSVANVRLNSPAKRIQPARAAKSNRI